jgi:hypothetical protein
LRSISIRDSAETDGGPDPPAVEKPYMSAGEKYAQRVKLLFVKYIFHLAWELLYSSTLNLTRKKLNVQ